jgi:hypothetical protein
MWPNAADFGFGKGFTEGKEIGRKPESTERPEWTDLFGFDEGGFTHQLQTGQSGAMIFDAEGLLDHGRDEPGQIGIRFLEVMFGGAFLTDHIARSGFDQIPDDGAAGNRIFHAALLSEIAGADPESFFHFQWHKFLVFHEHCPKWPEFPGPTERNASKRYYLLRMMTRAILGIGLCLSLGASVVCAGEGLWGAGMRLQGEVDLEPGHDYFWGPEISYSNFNLASHRLQFKFAYLTNRVEKVFHEGLIMQDYFLFTPTWHFRRNALFDPLLSVDLGY